LQVLEIDNLRFRYVDSRKEIIQDFSLSMEEGEILVLAGPSGCGKSTLLRTINGLIPHMYQGEYSGKVLVEGKDVSKTEMRVIAQKVGFLFQNPENQIFMFSVERDIAFGLENLGLPREEIRKRVDEAMELLHIEKLAARAPHELSDGQKQRVALAGVLAMKPSLVILDEPTSLLDPVTAKELVSSIEEINKKTRASFIIVEHRLDLVVRIADRIIVMYDGRKVFDDKPSRVLIDYDPEPYGVLVPPVTKLQRELVKSGIKINNSLLTPEELALKVGL
jgi:energy-coupling factor transporter ATP-binding protein EcfA2